MRQFLKDSNVHRYEYLKNNENKGDEEEWDF